MLEIDSNMKCNGLVEGNFGIDIELCQEGLDRGLSGVVTVTEWLRYRQAAILRCCVGRSWLVEAA